MVIQPRAPFKYFALFLFIGAVFSSCRSCGDKIEIDHHVDISNIQADLELHRFEKVLFESSLDSLEPSLNKFKKAHPEFFSVYVEQLMRLGRANDSSKRYIRELERFTRNEDIRGLYDTVKAKYEDFSAVEKELETAFRYYKYHFPEKDIPKVITYVSPFTYAAITGEDFVGIGLEMFLGRYYPVYQQIPNLPDYIIRTLTRESLPVNAMKAQVQGVFEQDKKATQMLDHMIYNGKVLFSLDALFPDVPDSIKIGYAAAEIEWIENYEGGVWQYLIDHDLFFESDRTKYHKYINVGPNTPGLPPEAPGNIGTYIGWQIVRKFMYEFPEVKLQELMGDTTYTAQKILKLSKYDP